MLVQRMLIHRISENTRLNGWVYVDTHDRDLGSYVNEARERIANTVELPSGYSLTWSGQYEYMVRAMERLSIVVPVTLIIIFIFLYLNFRKFTDVIIIIGFLPFALGGGAWFLYFLNFNLSVAVGVGFIALAGIAVEDGVVMLEFLNKSVRSTAGCREESGNSLLRNAILSVALQRVRPIIMTSCSTIAGLIPIMFITSTGSEVMQRVAAP